MTSFNTFDAATYSSKMTARENARKQLVDLSSKLHESEQQINAIREAKKAQARKLLEYKKGLDLRQEAKKDREERTKYLQEAGILLPNEFIAKVREPRVK